MATDVKVLRVRLAGTPEQVRGFLADHPMEAERVVKKDGLVTIDAFVDAIAVEGLRYRGLSVELLYDAQERGRARLKEVGKDNRFKGGRIPRGLGLRRFGG